MSTSRLLRVSALSGFVLLAAALPIGCGSTDDSSAVASGGSHAGTSNTSKAGSTSKGGSGPTIPTPDGSACDQQTPAANQPCSVTGLVCPTARGNCACTGGAWKCFEVAAGGSGSGGEAGAQGGGAGTSGASVAGNAGSA